MNSKVYEAVGVISRFVSEYWDEMVDDSELQGLLMSRGFTDQDISEAFNWIQGTTLGSIDFKDSSRQKPAVDIQVRLLSVQEKTKIHSRAYGFILKCLQRGILDAPLAESILERALQSDSEEVGLKQMKRFIALALFNQMQAEWKKEILSPTQMSRYLQ